MNPRGVAAMTAAGWLMAAGTAGADELSSADGRVSWTGAVQEGAPAPATELCAAAACDRFVLDLALPPDVWSEGGGVQVAIRWEDAARDLDLYVYDAEGELAGSSTGIPSSAESLLVEEAANGRYDVVVASTEGAGIAYEGVAEVERPPAAQPLRDLLPNLVPLEPRNTRLATGSYFFGHGAGETMSCYPDETIEHGAKRCLRFDQVVANVGEGPFELRYRMDDAATSPELRQRIHRSDGTTRDRFADTFEFHPFHAHFHYRAFARSALWASDEQGTRVGDGPVAVGRKNGFCMVDVEDIWFERKGDGARRYGFPGCNAPAERDADGTYMVNGISPGWADVYWWFLAGQYIEVSGVPDGYYLLETEVDPEDTVLEQENGDNVGATLIRLCGDRAEIVGGPPACSG